MIVPAKDLRLLNVVKNTQQKDEIFDYFDLIKVNKDSSLEAFNNQMLLRTPPKTSPQIEAPFFIRLEKNIPAFAEQANFDFSKWLKSGFVCYMKGVKNQTEIFHLIPVDEVQYPQTQDIIDSIKTLPEHLISIAKFPYKILAELEKANQAPFYITFLVQNVISVDLGEGYHCFIQLQL